VTSSPHKPTALGPSALRRLIRRAADKNGAFVEQSGRKRRQAGASALTPKTLKQAKIVAIGCD
jgi:hypothetical protein